MAQPCYIDTTPDQSLRHFSIRHSCLKRFSVAFLGTIFNLFLPAPNSLQSPDSLLYRHILHSKNSCLSNSLPFKHIQSAYSSAISLYEGSFKPGGGYWKSGGEPVLIWGVFSLLTGMLWWTWLKKKRLPGFSFLSLQWCMKSLLGYYTFPSKFISHCWPKDTPFYYSSYGSQIMVWLQWTSPRKSMSDICLCNPQEAVPKHPWEELQRIRHIFFWHSAWVTGLC